MAPLLLTKLFAKLSNGKDSVNASELAGFLVSSQGESHGHDDSLYANEEELASSLIIGFHRSRGHSDAPNAAGSSLDSLSFTEFLQFLLDPKLNPLMKPSEKPTHDMSRPMSDYFIYTSHNSYLTGNQLTSKSGTSMIKKALLDGCRVIELDCWDDHGVIKVFHGHTLTKPVSFEECLIAIKENAFVTSDYPVIITIEDHMGPDLQNEAAIKMRDIFGENLFVPSSNEKPPIQFASPELLKHKIIISDTPPKDAWHAQVAIDGVALDKARKSTAVIHNNKDPSWENEQFEFQIRVPEMAILRLEAWESDSSSKDDFVGQACFPVCEMKIGLRALTLKSRSGEPLPSTLLCSIHKQEPQKAL